jgi:hypothetical protein
MYALRGLAICSATFFLVYLALSIAVIIVWPKAFHHAQKRSAQFCADVLFLFRISPLFFGLLVTLLFAGPSFLIFEPRTANEPIGAWLPLLAFGGLAVLGAGAGNAALALQGISKAAAGWASSATAMSFPAKVTAQADFLRTTAIAPPLTTAGVFHPRVWLSSTAERLLSEPELHTALRHELVHVRRHDNLRKLFLRLVAFPGMAGLEIAWREATEMAADDGAVSNALEALDLAAAVIKLSRLTPLISPEELATSLVHGPAESLTARVSRLLMWSENRATPRPVNWGKPAFWTGASLIALAVTYSHLLLHVHAATELLVR